MPSSSPGRPADDLAHRLSMAVAPLARQIRQHSQSPFTATQLSVVGAIRRHGRITLGELAEVENVTSGTVSKAIMALEEQGVVVREYDPEDRRVCRVRISEVGEKWFVEHRARRAEWLGEQLQRLDNAEVAAIERALPALERLLDLGQ